MSALFNQTNLAPATPFATGGGLPPTVQNIVFAPATGSNTVSNQIASGFNPFDGTNNVAVFNGANGQLARLQVGGNLEVQETGNGPSTALQRILYAATDITWQQPNTGTSIPFMEVVASNSSFQLQNMSAINNNKIITGSTAGLIQYGSATLSGGSNAVSLTTPYASSNYTVILTQTSGQPTITPWAKITSSSTFEIAGDATAGVSWMTIGGQ